jgi:hypothetical protein
MHRPLIVNGIVELEDKDFKLFPPSLACIPLSGAPWVMSWKNHSKISWPKTSELSTHFSSFASPVTYQCLAYGRKYITHKCAY